MQLGGLSGGSLWAFPVGPGQSLNRRRSFDTLWTKEICMVDGYRFCFFFWEPKCQSEPKLGVNSDYTLYEGAH